MGIFWACLTYIVWGLTPVFWKQLTAISSLELLGQRVFWSFLCLIPVLYFQPRRRVEIRRLLTTDRQKLGLLALAAFLIGFNWYTFVEAMLTNRILETSLGYFLTPLMNILLSIVLLRERLSPLQKIAASVALLAAVTQTIKTGQPPQLALILSSSFACYAYLKKKIQVSAEVGLAAEAIFLMPFLGLFVFKNHGFHHTSREWLFLILSGPLTVIPMIWYTWALKKISLMSIAFLQYLSPFLQFFLAVFIYHEAFQWTQRITFFMTWIALGLFVWDLWLRYKEVPQLIVQKKAA